MIELTNCSLRVKQPSLTHSVMAYGILPNLHKRLVVSFMLSRRRRRDISEQLLTWSKIIITHSLSLSFTHSLTHSLIYSRMI